MLVNTYHLPARTFENVKNPWALHTPARFGFGATTSLPPPRMASPPRLTYPLSPPQTRRMPPVPAVFLMPAPSSATSEQPREVRDASVYAKPDAAALRNVASTLPTAILSTA